MEKKLQKETDEAIKKSFFNLLAVFFEQENINGAHVRCLLKWGILLQISENELQNIGKDLADTVFVLPHNEVEKLESLYHLVHMIYLDKVVEDNELEVATIYATRLGFKESLVGDLFKSIATSEVDIFSEMDVRKEVIDFLKIQNS